MRSKDMSPAFINAVIKNLPNVLLVFDRFYNMKLFNDKLSTLRRQLYRKAADDLQNDVLKGTRWLLLKNFENLDDSKDERKRLDEALNVNRSLATAYYLKGLLRYFWRQRTKADAAVWLDEWCALARASGIGVMKAFANTMQGHRWACSAGGTTRSRPARWKGPTKKSKPCNDRPTVTATASSSN